MEFEVLKQAIVDVLNVHPDEITKETTFTEDLCADSLDLYQICLEIQDKLNISLELDEVSGIKTVGEALDMLLNHKNSEN